MIPETLDLEKVIEQIQFWVDMYVDEYATSDQKEAAMRAEGAAVIAWIRQHCKREEND